MQEIEWLDADGSPIGAAPPQTRPSRRAPRATIRSPARWVEIIWLLSALLAVLAPFLELYSLRIETGNTQRVDGWGRFDTAVNAAEGTGAHGIRFGIVLVAAAALVLIALVLRRYRPVRGRVHRVATASFALAEGLLVATTASVFLDIDALVDSVRSELANFAVARQGLSLHLGAGTWTMLAATVLLRRDRGGRRAWTPAAASGDRHAAGRHSARTR